MLYQVTVTNHNGGEGVVTSTSGQTFLTSSPTNDNPGTNPEELLAAAWATCLNATIQAILSARGYTNTQSRVGVSVTLNKESSGYYFGIDAKASVQNLTIEQATQIVESAHKRCPISKIIGEYDYLTLQTEAYE